MINNQKKNKCQICSQFGNIKCQKCKNVLYCSERHRKIDLHNIHNLICDFLKELNTPEPVSLTSIERSIQKQKLHEIKVHILNICKEQRQEKIWLNKHAEAIPALMQELRWINDLYGSVSTEAISTYCTLGEVTLHLDSLDKADEYLGQALWCFQRGSVSNTIKFHVYRVLGKLYEARGMILELRDALAEHIYYGAENWGPTSLQLTWGFLHLGLSFNEKPLIAYSFFDKVISITKTYVMPFIEKYFDQKETEIPTWESEQIYHNEDLLKMLTTTKEQIDGPCAEYVTVQELTDLFFLLGVFHHLLATNKAKEYLEKARDTGENKEECAEMVTATKTLIQKEEKRLTKWLQRKMSDAMTWEGMPGTWHDIDACSNDSSCANLIRYYDMEDRKSDIT